MLFKSYIKHSLQLLLNALVRTVKSFSSSRNELERWQLLNGIQATSVRTQSPVLVANIYEVQI